jgi:hypothetical protein
MDYINSLKLAIITERDILEIKLFYGKQKQIEKNFLLI